MTQDQAYLRAKKVVRARRNFYGHAMVYAVVNAALFFIDSLTPGGPWFFWPLAFWGIGLVIDGLVTFTGLTPGSEAEERAIEHYLAKHPR